MTIKQDKMIAEFERQKLAGEPISIQKAGKVAKYSEKYMKASIYTDIRKPNNIAGKWLAEYVGRDQIFKDIKGIERDAKKKEDLSNRSRMVELRCKIGRLTDAPTQVNVFQQFTTGTLDRLSTTYSGIEGQESRETNT